MQISDDTRSAVLQAAGPLGSAQVGVKEKDGTLSGVAEIQVLATDAISLAIVMGIPESL